MLIDLYKLIEKKKLNKLFSLLLTTFIFIIAKKKVKFITVINSF